MKIKSKSMIIGILIGVTFILQGCSSNQLNAPCDDYGQHCDPKVKINQWTPTQP